MLTQAELTADQQQVTTIALITTESAAELTQLKQILSLLVALVRESLLTSVATELKFLLNFLPHIRKKSGILIVCRQENIGG